MIAWFAVVLAQLAGYWPVSGHAMATPSSLMAVAAVALTGVIISFLARGRRHGPAADRARGSAAREVLVRRIPAAARPGRARPGPAPGTIGAPGGRLTTPPV